MAEKQDPARPDNLFEGRYHFSPSHLLNIASTFPRQRQSRQGNARTFIFKKAAYCQVRAATGFWGGRIHAAKIMFLWFGSESTGCVTSCSFIPHSIKECRLQEMITDPSQNETKVTQKIPRCCIQGHRSILGLYLHLAT